MVNKIDYYRYKSLLGLFKPVKFTESEKLFLKSCEVKIYSKGGIDLNDFRCNIYIKNDPEFINDSCLVLHKMEDNYWLVYIFVTNTNTYSYFKFDYFNDVKYFIENYIYNGY